MKRISITQLLISFIGSTLLLSTPGARADATVYWDYDDGFSPSTVVIGPGENVTWWNIDPYGFDVTVMFNGLDFSLQQYDGMQVHFPAQPGVYSYQSDWGDYGQVIVNIPPTVSIISPTNTAVFPAPATFSVRATASDTPDDYVVDVQFYLCTVDSTNSIADVFSPPYTNSVTNLAAGSYTLLAVATDSRGASATNAVTITVGSTVNLSSPRIWAGQFLFDVTGVAAGKTNILLASTNLQVWTAVRTNIASGASFTMTNVPAAVRQFYRVSQLP